MAWVKLGGTIGAAVGLVVGVPGGTVGLGVGAFVGFFVGATVGCVLEFDIQRNMMAYCRRNCSMRYMAQTSKNMMNKESKRYHASTDLLGRLGSRSNPIGIHDASARVSGITGESRAASLGPPVPSSADGGGSALLRPLTGGRTGNAKDVRSGGLGRRGSWRGRQCRRLGRTRSWLACG